MLRSAWIVNGRAATALELMQAMALARAYATRQRRSDREARELEQAARAVGRAIRKAERARERMAFGCKPAPVSGQRSGGVKLRGFEKMLGLHSGRSHAMTKAHSSFHFKITPRGLGSHRRNGSRGYQAGEAVRAVRYILRDAAREIEGGGIVSSISSDPDAIAAVFAAIEELEMAGGRSNANVYSSLVVSLPHELNSREELLDAICSPLSDMGLPFAAVLHAPDPRGDERNYHAHILFSWRPFALSGDGIAFSDLTVGSANTPEFVCDYRQHVASAMNEAMMDAGLPRRFTAEKTRRAADNGKSAKYTPGQKHHQRRQAAIEEGKAEYRLLTERRSALDRLERLAVQWAGIGSSRRSMMIDPLLAREGDLIKAQFDAPAPKPAAMTPALLSAPTPVSREKQHDGPEETIIGDALAQVASLIVAEHVPRATDTSEVPKAPGPKVDTASTSPSTQLAVPSPVIASDPHPNADEEALRFEPVSSAQPAHTVDIERPTISTTGEPSPQGPYFAPAPVSLPAAASFIDPLTGEEREAARFKIERRILAKRRKDASSAETPPEPRVSEDIPVAGKAQTEPTDLVAVLSMLKGIPLLPIRPMQKTGSAPFFELVIPEEGWNGIPPQVKAVETEPAVQNVLAKTYAAMLKRAEYLATVETGSRPSPTLLASIEKFDRSLVKALAVGGRNEMTDAMTNRVDRFWQHRETGGRAAETFSPSQSRQVEEPRTSSHAPLADEGADLVSLHSQMKRSKLSRE